MSRMETEGDSSMTNFDVAVVGLGAVGSLIARDLAEAGYSVAGFERATALHPTAAYAGDSRLFRVAYHEGPEYVDALLYSRQEWSRLDRMSGANVFLRNGVASIGAESSDEMRGVLDSVDEFSLPHTRLNGDEISTWLPQLKDTADDIAIIDELGGVLRPELAVWLFQDAARRAGAALFDRTPVDAIEEGPDRVRIVAGDEEWSASQVIVTSGVWTKDLVPAVSSLLDIRPIPLLWFLTDPEYDFSTGTFPGFIRDKNGQHVYGLPSLDGMTMKAGSGHGREPIDNAALLPDRLDQATVEESAETICGFLNGLSSYPIRSSIHMDVYTSDSRPIIDKASPRVTVSTGYSGHGFKLTPAWARASIDVALEREPRFSLHNYRIDRFAKVGDA
ncbi:FAD-dependent oxidoreductase [Brevibacterium sp. S111]|nr:FAD-dependent oxidoreductase [Brevibacterium sp. S111]